MTYAKNNKEYQSKYYATEPEAIPSDWTREEFLYALSILEHLPLEKLKELSEGFRVFFSQAFNVDEEDYIDVLLHEPTKEALLEVLRKSE